MEWILMCVFVTVNLNFVILNEVPQNVTSSPCTDSNHIFLVPGVLSAGGSSRGCVSRFHPAGPVRMVVTLYTQTQPAVTAVREMGSGDGGCIDIAVPLLPNTKAEMVVMMRYPQCTWERRVQTRISGTRVVVAHTQRARVRPGEVVRARVYALKADLTPARGAIEEIWLEGPRGSFEGSRVAEWRQVRTRLGVAQIQHALDDQAPPGRWTFRIKMADGSQGSTAFQVGDYQLPPFQLSVRHAPTVLSTSERLVWTVCVRYPWTEAVEGMLVIRIRGAGQQYNSSSTNSIRTAVRLRAPRACHRHAAAARRVGLGGGSAPDVVVADFSFQEESTRIWQNTTVVSRVVDKPVSLEFLTKQRAVVSPWLPFKLKVKATRWDSRPASNEVVKVCKTSASSADQPEQAQPRVCNEANTDDKGIARVLFNPQDDGSIYYRFLATLSNDSTISSAPLYLPVQRQGSVHAALGPLKSDGHDVRTFVPLYLTLRNVLKALTVHFVVITRGGIIYRWGATTQCPLTSSTDEVKTAARDSSCYDNADPNYDIDNLNHDVDNLNRDVDNFNHDAGWFNRGADRYNRNADRFNRDSKKPNYFNHTSTDFNQEPIDISDKQMLRVMLPVKISHQMCPDSHLIAYFYYKGELISASKHFEMEECFPNKVEATFPSRQAAPGSTTSLQLSTSGPALCALTALNSASKWVQPTPSVKETLMSGLKKLVEGHRNLTEYDADGDCFLTTDTPTTPSTTLELTASWLASAGIRLVGPAHRAACTTAPAPLIADDLTIPRSDFSEAWLWRLVPVDSNGTATIEAKAPDSITRYEASAVCVSRTGVDVSQPAVLQVFREFFIHADSPLRLRRGDTSMVRYRLFNYLYEPLSVQIQVLTDPHLEGPKELVESACIAGRSSIARRIEIKAKLPGNARVSVRAKSVKDGGCGSPNGKGGVSDEVIIEMKVDPEGIPVQDQKSMLLCGKGSLESSSSEVSWSWPAVQAVPGTEALNVWAIGDIAGPLLVDADDLVLLPRGCGEQNLARMATSLLALKLLHADSSAYAIAKQHVARGFTRQLQYAHPVGGFSAFGASDASPSTWLTAFTVRYLKKAHQVLSPTQAPPPLLARAERWLLAQQMENGCFRNEGQVFHRELRGGLSEEGEIASVALTAYVITSLVESSVLPSRVIRNALSCLRALPPPKSKSPTRVYAHSLLAYAFMRLKRYEDEVQKVNEASQFAREAEGLGVDEEVRQLAELMKLASRGGDLVWWDTGSLSTSIEATGYALLAVSLCPVALRESFAHDARAAVRWLNTQRNPSGGFVATQDTLIALEALTSWSSTQPATSTWLNVTARSGASRSGITRSVTLTPGDKVPEVMKMGAGEALNVQVEGTGCALIQATRSYNSYSAPPQHRDKQLSVQVTVHTDGVFDCDNRTSCYCAAVVETCVLWTGTFPEMALLEVTLPGGFGADASLLYSQLHKEDTLLRRIELSQPRITYYLGSRGPPVTAGHHCWLTHAVGPQSRTQPAHVIVKNYYEPSVNDTQMYTIPEECPPRITHDSNQYVPSDNLYVKARSADGDDIIISEDFTFEDIPDGIALEDPLYDNLTKGTTKAIMGKESPSKDDVKDKDEVVETERVTNREDNLEQEEIANSQDNRGQDHSDIRTSNGNVLNNRQNVEFSEPNTGNLFKQSIEPMRTFISLARGDIEVIDSTNKTENLDNEGREDVANNEKEESDASTNMTSSESNEKRNVDKIVKHERKSKFFTNDETYFEGFDPKPIEVEMNSDESTKVRENEIPKAIDIESKEKNTNGETSQNTDPNAEKEKLEIMKEVENPNLSSFHVIDSVTDLDVPTGIEGPIPAVVLPPPNLSRNYVTKPYDEHSDFEQISNMPKNFHYPPYKHPYATQGYQQNQPETEQLTKKPSILPYQSGPAMFGVGPYTVYQPRTYFYHPMVPDVYARDIRSKKNIGSGSNR